MPDPWDGEKPDAAGIDALHTHLSNVWQAVRTEMEEIDGYKGGTFQVWARDDKRPAFHPPTARYVIDHAVDTQMSVDPKVKKYALGEGDIHKKRADAVEPGLTAVMMDAALRESSIPWRQAYSYMLTYGYGVMGTLWDEAEAVGKPRQQAGESDDEYQARIRQLEAERAGWNPVRIKAPHPSRVLMNPYEMQSDVAVLTGKRYSQDLANLVKRKGRYGSKRVSSYSVDSNPYRLVNTLEVWTKNWHVVKITAEGDNLVVERNPFGFQPYIHGFAGWGGEVTDATDADPKHLAVSMLAGIKELLRVQAQKASAIHNLVLEHGFARLGTTKNSEEAAQQLERGSEAVLQGTKDDFWWLQYPQVSNWVFESQARDDKEIESATYVRALSGEKQQGVTTVGQQMILTQAANRKFYVPAKQIDRMATIIGSRILRMVTIRGEPITLQGTTLKASDIEGSFDVFITFQQFDPLIQMDMRRLGMQEVAQGLKSAETYRESDALMENEVEEQKRLLAAEVDKLPAVHQEMLVAAIREKGFLQLADRMSAALHGQQNALAAQMEPADAGAPAGNGAAAPMMPAGNGTGAPPAMS